MRPKRKKVAAVGLRDICICFLKDYAGFTKPNDLLERLAKELSNTQPKKPIRFGTQERPDPRFQPAPAPHEGWVP